MIMNKAIGRTSKRINKAGKTRIFTSEHEANSYFREERKKPDVFAVKGLLDVPNLKVHMVKLSFEKKNMTSGFLPIGISIYDRARADMAVLCRNSEKNGLLVMKINTDALFVSGIHTMETHDKNLYENMGKLNMKIKKLSSELSIEKTFDFKYIAPEIVNVNKIKIVDEYDIKECNKALSVEGNIQITAVCAGAGKTSMCETFFGANREGKKFITPYNKQAFKLRMNRFYANTLHKLLGVRINGEENEEVNKSKIETDHLELIVFDS